jgi:hypothetical protein
VSEVNKAAQEKIKEAFANLNAKEGPPKNKDSSLI